MRFYILISTILCASNYSLADSLHNKINNRLLDSISADQFEIVPLVFDSCDILDSYVIGESGGYSFIASSYMEAEISSLNDVSILETEELIVKRILDRKFSESISNIAKYYGYDLEFYEKDFYESFVNNGIVSVFNTKKHDVSVFYSLYWLETMITDRDFLPVYGYYMDGRVLVLYSHDDSIVFFHVYDARNDTALEMKYEFRKGIPSCGQIMGIARMYKNMYGVEN